MKTKIIYTLSLLCAILLQACKHSPEALEIVLPANLVYAPNSLSLTEGSNGLSVTPVLEGTQPINFSITTTPAIYDAITVSPEGVIQVHNTLASGTYKVHVHTDNAAGSTVFQDAFTIQVNKAQTAPAALSYSPGSVNIVAGTAISSSVPAVSGTSPITYSLNASQTADGKISIGADGVISASTALPAGTYSLDVTATNALGSTTFSEAFSITVSNSAEPPTALAYAPNSLSMNSGSTASSVVPGISGSSPMTFSLSVTPNAAGNISIDERGVITASSQLTPNTYTISVTATNAVGSNTFNNAYQVAVQELVYVSFEKDIKPIISSNCTSCHTTGPQTIYTNYTNAKTNINLILDRIQRTPKSAGFMPKNGTKLTDAEINLFKKWLSDGLKEN